MTPPWFYTRLVVYTFVPVCPKKMKTMYQPFPRISYVRTYVV